MAAATSGWAFAALEEALCFGWIDGQLKSIDDEKYLKKFTPRRKKSKWSEKNRNLASILIKSGKMIEYGIAAIEVAKKSGTWDIPKKGIKGTPYLIISYHSIIK